VPAACAVSSLFFLTLASQTKTILLAILIAESENELSISSFLRATKNAIRSEVEILREVLLAFARALSMHSTHNCIHAGTQLSAHNGGQAT